MSNLIEGIVSIMMILFGVLYVWLYERMICCKSLCVFVVGVLFRESCFALLVVVSMIMMVFVRSCFCMWFNVRWSVNVLCRVMSYCNCGLSFFLLMLFN